MFSFCVKLIRRASKTGGLMSVSAVKPLGNHLRTFENKVPKAKETEDPIFDKLFTSKFNKSKASLQDGRLKFHKKPKGFKYRLSLGQYIGKQPIKDLATSENEALYILKDGTAYSLGFSEIPGTVNKNLKEKPREHTWVEKSVRNPIRRLSKKYMESLPKLAAKKVALGKGHGVILLKNGSLYGIGSNHFGNLALPNGGFYKTPTWIPLGNEEVKDVDCGAFFTSILTKKGEVYSFGLNFGEDPLLEAEGAKQITCSFLDTYILDKKGTVMANIFKTDEKTEQRSLEAVRFDLPEKIKEIKAGAHFCSAISEEGTFYLLSAQEKSFLKFESEARIQKAYPSGDQFIIQSDKGFTVV